MRAGRLSIVNKSDPMAPTHYILSAAVLPQPAAAISSRRLQSPPRRARPRMAVRPGALAYRRKIQNMLTSFLKEHFHLWGGHKILTKSYIIFKVQIFWEGHKIFPIFHLLSDATKQCQIKSGRWDKILGFSQTIWTLISHNNHQRKWKLSNFCGLINDCKKFMKTFEKNRIKNACSKRIQPQLSRNLSSIELS